MLAETFPARWGFELSNMKMPLATTCGLLLMVGCAPAQAANKRASVVVDGTLSHYRDAVWQVQIPASKSIQVAGKSVHTIRIVNPFLDITWAHKYDGENVEISGDVDTGETDSLKHGIATMTLHTMTPSEPGPTPLMEVIRRNITHEANPNHHAPGQPLYRFAYYLVLFDEPIGCERCYVPLLISPEPIEWLARNKGSVTVASITTYERDSIWQVNGLALITSDALEPSNAIHFRGRNYRYEPAPDGQVLHLLEHPLGTIPISRPALPHTEAPGASFSDLIADFHTIFRVLERRNGPPDAVFPLEKRNPFPTSLPTAGTSELTIFDDGEVEYRFAPGCISHSNPTEVQKWHEAAVNWNWRETCPGSQGAEMSFDYSLKPTQLSELQGLLNREDVKQWQGCFCNASLGLGDYTIEIPRQELTQQIFVVGFMAQHISLRENPTLTDLICEAKMISHHNSNQALPSWCSDRNTK
jgi:hypothetical protein